MLLLQQKQGANSNQPRYKCQVKKVFVKDKEVVNIVIDPLKETADVNTGDNMFPRVKEVSKFDELKKKGK